MTGRLASCPFTGILCFIEFEKDSCVKLLCLEQINMERQQRNRYQQTNIHAASYSNSFTKKVCLKRSFGLNFTTKVKTACVACNFAAFCKQKWRIIKSWIFLNSSRVSAMTTFTELSEEFWDDKRTKSLNGQPKTLIIQNMI
jgi:hypothetical protein